jgi:hypothetical protein
LVPRNRTIGPGYPAAVAYRSDPELLVLTVLRVASFPSTDVVVERTDVGRDEADAVLTDLRDRELARFRDGALSGWFLTPAGRAAASDELRAELEAAGAGPVVRSSYDEFLALNQELLHVCTDWQLLGGEGSTELNDHRDAAYDAIVISRLAAVHDKVGPILADLADALERFAGYESRLGFALERVQRGAAGGDDWADWFTKPTIDSYHTVWFELHENLLATLGIERSSEAQP